MERSILSQIALGRDGSMATLQSPLVWGWSVARAALGMLPQSAAQAGEFARAITLAGWVLTGVSALLVAWGFLCPRLAPAAEPAAA